MNTEHCDKANIEEYVVWGLLFITENSQAIERPGRANHRATILCSCPTLQQLYYLVVLLCSSSTV